MKKTCNIFLCVMVLLFMGQIITGGLTFLKKGTSMGYLTPIEDWTEESSEEDESKIFEDDLDVFTRYSLLIRITSLEQENYLTLFDLKEHVAEIIPPPPQV